MQRGEFHNTQMIDAIGLIGFGEAGRTFAQAGQWGSATHVFDIKTDAEATRESKLREYEAVGVRGWDSLGEALGQVTLVLSLVTADEALKVAEAAADTIQFGTIYCDMNSVAPQTKQAAAQVIEAAGGSYVDVAVMAPVDPARMAVPLLLSGERAQQVAPLLTALGFSNIRIVGDTVGRASSIKMIRSVMVKGIEALTAECMLAAEAAGVCEEVLASLDASDKPKPWPERADYNLDRMMVHGLRRAAEMEEVVKTLEALGTGAAMTRGTVERQRAIGSLALSAPAIGIDAKLKQIHSKSGTHA